MRTKLLPLLLLVISACQKQTDTPKPQEGASISKQQENITASKPKREYFKATLNGVPFIGTVTYAGQYGLSYQTLSIFADDSSRIDQSGQPLRMRLTLTNYYAIPPRVSFPDFSAASGYGEYTFNGATYYGFNGQAVITKYPKKTRKGGMITGTFNFVTQNGDIVENGEFFVMTQQYYPPLF